MNTRNILLSIFIGMLFLFGISSNVRASLIDVSIVASSEDGLIHTSYNPNNGEGTDWNSIRNEQTNLTIDCETIGNTGVGIGATMSNEGVWSGLIKSIFPFDTSIIPDNAIIKSAKVHIFTLYKENNGNYSYFDWNVYGAYPESTKKLVNADFLNIGSLPFSSAIDFDNTAFDGGDNIFKLNSRGIDFINKNGITSFGIRTEYYDVLNNEPIWKSYKSAVVKVIFSEHPDVAKRPYLEIEYEIPEDKITPLILIPGIMGSWPVDGELVLDPMLNTYKNLWQALLNSGYKEGVNLFAFPYEWRNSNVRTAGLLAKKIEEVKNIASSSKVDIVAHSMGGLVAREYLSDVDNLKNVNQLIFLSTPHRGAPSAYLTWEGGEFGEKFVAKVKKRIFYQEAKEHGYKNVYKYVRGRNISSVRELLPIFDYLYNRDNQSLRIYPNNYPQNLFLENLNNDSVLSGLSEIKTLNLVATASGSTTLNYIVVKNKHKKNIWEHGSPVNYIYGQGDTTVPSRSNSEGFDFDETRSFTSTHSGIVTDAQQDVIEVLTGERPAEKINTAKMNKKMLLFQLFSPVDMQIKDEQGERLGKDFAADKNLMEIKNSYYSGFENSSEFATILNPEEGDYDLSLEGVADGRYKLLVSYITDDNLVEKEVKGRIRDGEIRNLQIDFGGEDLSVLASSSFEKILFDLETLHNNGEIRKTKIYKRTKKQLITLKKRYENLDNMKRRWKKKMFSRMIKIRLMILERQLKFYQQRRWISSEARVVLKSDIQELIDML